jgi:hypothetical protein
MSVHHFVERKANTCLSATYDPNKRVLTRYDEYPLQFLRGEYRLVHSLEQAIKGLNLAREPTIVVTRHPDLMCSPPEFFMIMMLGRLFSPKTNLGKKVLREWITYPLMNASERKKKVFYYTKHTDECANLRKILPPLIDVKSIPGIVALLETSCRLKLPDTPMALMRHLKKFIGPDGIIDDNWPLLHQYREQRAAKINYSKRLVPDLIQSKDRFSVWSSKKSFLSMYGLHVKKYKKRTVLWSNAPLNCLSTDFLAINGCIARIEDEVIHECWKVVQRYDIEKVANALATLDVLTTFATVAVERGWCMAERSDRIDVKGLVHPLVERCVPNDVSVNNLMVMTGWNSSGKSTLMKAVGVAILLNQMGSFVPARHARLPLFDGVFAILKEDQRTESSFVHHCHSLAYIQKKCTPDSFIMLDEPCNSTDAKAGQALAEQMLRKTPGVKMITTHLRFDFTDRNTNMDTEHHLREFQLKRGPSQTSHAFAFCEGLGLHPEIINASRSFFLN